MRVGVKRSEKRRSRRHGIGVLAEMLLEDQRVGGQAVDVGSGLSGIAIASDVIDARGVYYADDEAGTGE